MGSDQPAGWGGLKQWPCMHVSHPHIAPGMPALAHVTLIGPFTPQLPGAVQTPGPTRADRASPFLSSHSLLSEWYSASRLLIMELDPCKQNRQCPEWLGALTSEASCLLCPFAVVWPLCASVSFLV
jgi:hypothetical protein